MKFGKFIKHSKRNSFFFFKKHAKNEARKLVPDPLLFFKKALHEVKPSCLLLSFNMLSFNMLSSCLVSIYFDSPQLGIQ